MLGVDHDSQHPVAPALHLCDSSRRKTSRLLAEVLPARSPALPQIPFSLSAQHIFSFHWYNLSFQDYSGFILLNKKCLPSRTGAVLMEEQEEDFEPGNPFSLHSSPTRSAGSPSDSDPIFRNRSKQKNNRVLSNFSLIRQKWIPLQTP